MKSIAPLIFALAVVASPAMVCAAFTMPVGGGLKGLLEALGGVTGYTADAEVNGQSVNVSAAGFPGQTPRAVAAENAAALGIPPGTVELDEGVVADDGGEGRMLLVPDGNGGTVAWAVTPAKNGAPLNLPAKNGAPLSPLAKPVFTATNKTSGAELAVGTGVGTPQSLRESQGAHLISQGWDAVETGGDTGLDVFVRDNHVCLVWATADESTGEARLAVFCR